MQFHRVNVGKFFTQVLESFEFVFATPFTKALPSTQVLCADKERISSWY
jgi:hypothetical protein